MSSEASCESSDDDENDTISVDEAMDQEPAVIPASPQAVDEPRFYIPTIYD